MTGATLHGGSSWSRLIGSSSRRALVAVTLSVTAAVVVPVVAIAAGFTTGVFDPLRNLNNPVAAAAAASKAAHAAAVAKLPALVDLTGALTNGPPGWAGNGALSSGASLPSVVDCVPSPITPVVTVGRGFAVAGAQIQVTLAAYVAGAGGLVFNSQFSGIPACSVPGGSSTVTAGAADGPGVSRFSVSTSQAGVLTTTQVWRRGDVIAYLSGADPTTEAGLASTMDQTLTKALGSDCVNQNSLATDNVRDPFAVLMRSDFKGLTVDQGINQPPTPLPSPTTIEELVTVPVTAAPASPAPGVTQSPAVAVTQSPTAVAVTQGPLGVTLPAPAVAVTPSKPPWPVYPPLPTLTPAPIPPSAPSSEPPTHASLRESQVDTLGPGCGWAFTDMIAPTPPTVLPASVLAARQASLQPLLTKAQAAWQVSVNAYWIAYTAYLTQAQNYAAFTDQVNQVSAAWSVIDGQWETYFMLKAAYEQMVTDHNAFVKAQAAALAAYNANQATCTPSAVVPTVGAVPGATAAPADESGPHARRAPADSPTPSDSASASASPSSGGGLFPPAPVPTATATPSATAPAAAPTDTATAPATDMPPPAATTAPPPAAVFGTPCESPPAILSQTPPPAPTGPPPTKPADPRPKPTPTVASSSPSAAASHR